MPPKTFYFEIVSPVAHIYSGNIDMLLIKGAEGDLGITPGHLQLLTSIPPGVLHAYQGGGENLLYISGGILEVQPQHVTIMADVVKRPQDINEAAALAARKEAEKVLAGKIKVTDFKQAQLNLEEALAKLKVVELMRLRQKQRH